MKNKIYYLVLLVLMIPAFWWLTGSGYFNMHDDLQVMRFFQMNKCFLDGQIPCRWSPDMVWGYGQPMFNFYSAFPYYFGTLLHFMFSINFLTTVKIVFLLSFLIAGYGMYFLAKEFWGRTGGLLSAVLYTYAPYHALDIYVRGAMSETFAISLLPWMWYFLYKLIKKYSLLSFVGSAVIISFVLSSHNISTMIYAPLTALWCSYWLIIEKKVKSVVAVVLSGVLGIGLSAYFIIPAVVEQKIIQTQFLTTNYSDFRGHFVTLKQLFISRTWGDGPSIFGDAEDISFQIGWPHWWLGILAFLNIIYLKFKKKTDLKILLFVSGLVALALFFSFMTHHRSQFIWEAIPKLNFVQFPWRFLGLVIFFLSFSVGSINLEKKIFIKFVSLTLMLLTIVINYKYFIPVHFSRQVTEEQKLSGVAFELQQKSAILDYLPKTAEEAPPAKAFENPKLLSGDASVSSYSKSSDSFSFDADVYINNSSVIVPVMYFPGWQVFVDGKKVSAEINGAHGLIKVTLDEGRHFIYGVFENTPIREVANTITILSCGVLIILVSKEREDGKNTKKNK